MALPGKHNVVILARENVRLLSFLQSAVKKESFSESLSEHGLDVSVTGSFINPGTLVGFAYVGLVWLREVEGTGFEKKIPDVALAVADECWSGLNDTITKWPEGKDVKLHRYLKSIRNALSHGHVEFGAHSYLRLWDQKGQGANPHTEIKILATRLGELTSAVVSRIVD